MESINICEIYLHNTIDWGFSGLKMALLEVLYFRYYPVSQGCVFLIAAEFCYYHFNSIFLNRSDFLLASESY